MKNLKALTIFALGAVVGFGIAVAGSSLKRHIDLARTVRRLEQRAATGLDRTFRAKVSAAKLSNITPPAPYFPTGSIWTKDISHAPLDPQSSTMISSLADAGGWGRGRLQIDFSMRVLQADASTPQVKFKPGARFITPDSDEPASIPLPVGGGIEGADGYQCKFGDSDCHLLVVDRGHGKLYEAWGATEADSTLTALFMGVWDLHRVYPPSGRGDQCTSADAGGFPIAPLLFNADELATGHIDHAIRFILPVNRIRPGSFVHPATHASKGRGTPSNPPYGAHFRLKASFDLSQLSPTARVVAQAMQKYGMFLADQGNIALTAQNDQDTKAKYADLNFGPHDLEAIKVTDFEVVEGGSEIPLTFDCVRKP